MDAIMSAVVDDASELAGDGGAACTVAVDDCKRYPFYMRTLAYDTTIYVNTCTHQYGYIVGAIQTYQFKRFTKIHV